MGWCREQYFRSGLSLQNILCQYGSPEVKYNAMSVSLTCSPTACREQRGRVQQGLLLGGELMCPQD